MTKSSSHGVAIWDNSDLSAFHRERIHALAEYRSNKSAPCLKSSRLAMLSASSARMECSSCSSVRATATWKPANLLLGKERIRKYCPIASMRNIKTAKARTSMDRRNGRVFAMSQPGHSKNQPMAKRCHPSLPTVLAVGSIFTLIPRSAAASSRRDQSSRFDGLLRRRRHRRR